MKDTASENGFYNLNIQAEKFTLEHKLSKLETICSKVIKKICSENSLSNITEEEHKMLCLFMANAT